MKIYIETKLMIFEDGEHELILKAKSEIFYGYDFFIEEGILKACKMGGDYIIREENTWWSFPLFEIIDGNIMDFNPFDYDYFNETDRRNKLAEKIKEAYNPPSENKIMRKTLKTILDNLGLKDESFERYNNKVESIIKKIPKGGK